MNTGNAPRSGHRGDRQGRDAVTGSAAVMDGGRRGRTGDRADSGAPEAADTESRSYYGRPVLNPIVWEERDIAGYLFLGGLAGASSALAAGADLTGRPNLAGPLKYTALGALTGSFAALVHDLGRPERFANMLRVVKPTSPMSVGSWLLLGYGPLVAAVGPAVAAYTAPLICDTAVPAWHEGYREMPFVFVGSAAAASGGVGLLAAPVDQAAPARRAAVLGSVVETAAMALMERRLGMLAEPYTTGRGGALLRTAKALTLAGAAGALLGGRSRRVSLLSGAALVAGSVCTRFGIFAAGVRSAADPKYTVVPQRRRLLERDAQRRQAGSG